MALKTLRTVLLLTFFVTLFASVNPSFATHECPAFSQIVNYGDRVTGTVTNADYAVFYCFTGTSGEEITIEMTATSGNLDTYLFLTSPTADNVYATNDDIASGNTNSRIQTTLTVSGDLVITATRYNLERGLSTGSFELTLRRTNVQAAPTIAPTSTPLPRPTSVPTVAAVPTSASVPVSDELPACNEGLDFIIEAQLNAQVTGEITNDEYAIFYCVNAKRGDQLTIETEATSGNLDTVLGLTNVDLDNLGFNDDIGAGNRNSRIEFEVQQDGVYIITVSRFNGETGTSAGEYNLWIGKPYTCDEAPWSDLIAERWIQRDDQGVETLVIDFACDGKVDITLNGQLFSDIYTFDRDRIEMVSSGIVFEDVLVIPGILFATLEDTFLLLATESILNAGE